MIVRDLRSRTKHKIYGPLERGFIRSINPIHFNSDLFEIIPERPEDIPVACVDDKGRSTSAARSAATRKKKFGEFNKRLRPQYEEENKLACERLRGRVI